MPFKMAPFLSFFYEQCMKRRRFGQNAPFHFNENDAKFMSDFTLVLNYDLFNQVLNCNFDLKINAIASLPKIKQRP